MWTGMQIAAMLAMLIDHIGYLFFADIPLYRFIGRIAFPLYTYGIVLGYHYTSNAKRYIRRLFLLALVSQLPFMLVFRTYALNVIFTLLASLLTIMAIDRADSRGRKWTILCFTLIVTFIIPMDYGWYGVLLACIYRYAKGNRMIAGHLLLNFADALLAWHYVQLFSILPTMAIAWFPDIVKKRSRAVPVWIWRSFYPAHLAALGFISLFINYRLLP
jgi:hypothetical protein